MSKRLSIILALLVLLAFTGSVMATPVTGGDSTIITSTIAVDTITVVAPETATWNLNRANVNDNEQYLGAVSVTSDGGWHLTAQDANALNGHLVYGNTLSTNPVFIRNVDGITYNTLVDATPTIGEGIAGGPFNAYIYLKNTVGSETGSGTITLTFTGTIP
jgi:VCBS repeat-containing protein